MKIRRCVLVSVCRETQYNGKGIAYTIPMTAKDFIEVDPEKMSGTPVFTGTRVPINHLLDYLKAGDSLNTFLADFPTVTREQALGVLELMRERLLTEYETAA